MNSREALITAAILDCTERANTVSLAASEEDQEVLDHLNDQQVYEQIARRVDEANREIASKGLLLAAADASQAHYGDYYDVGSIIDRIEATGPTPQKLLGDLAQTSVGTGAGETQVLALSEWTLEYKRKTADATTTDDATWGSSIGSTKEWSVKSKYMFVSGDTSQAQSILAAINTVQSAQPWNFFPTIGTGREVWSGLAYVESITLATGIGKVVGLDITLKGTGPLTQGVQLAPVANPNTVTGQQAEV